MCHCLVYDAPWRVHNYIIGCYSNTLRRRWQMTHNSAVILMLVEYIIWNGIVLASDWQIVSWYWCMFDSECVSEFKCDIAWCTMHASWHDHNCTLGCYSKRYNGYDGTWHTTLRWCWCWLNILYGTLPCWFWIYRKYVGIGACLNPNVSLLDIWCTMTWSQLHIWLLFQTLQRRWYMKHDSKPLWCSLDIWNGVVLVLDEQIVRWYWCMFEFEYVIAYLSLVYMFIFHHVVVWIM